MGCATLRALYDFAGESILTQQIYETINYLMYQSLIFDTTICIYLDNMGGSILSKMSAADQTKALFGLTIASLLAYFQYQHYKNTEEIQGLEEKIMNIHQQQFLKIINEESICQELKEKRKHPIYKIAITGGPCGGKSTSLDNIKEHFESKGFKVLSVPEVPTIVSLGGGFVLWKGQSTVQRIKFQTSMMKLKFMLEDYITHIGSMSKQPCIILCDRGMVDFAAYMKPQQYQAMRDEQGWTWATLRDRRYDSVIFLNSAAVGAEQFYTTANNAARTETIEQARDLDYRTLSAWIGHPHLTICPNIKGRSFKDKLVRALRTVQRTVGLEEADVTYQKFLIRKPQFPPELVVVESEVEEYFLVNKSKRYIFDKIKKRGQNGSFTYQRKLLGYKMPGQRYREEIRKPLNSLQYELLIEQKADNQYKKLSLTRLNFALPNSVYYSIDHFTNAPDREQVYLLRFTTESYENGQDYIPDFLNVVRDVREETTYQQHNIARINK